MIILPYKKHSSVSGIRLFLFLSLHLVCALILANGAYAQMDFAQLYHV